MKDTRDAAQKKQEQQQQKSERKTWNQPKLERKENLPRVTNGFVGSFTP